MPVTPAKRAHPHRALKGQTPHTPLVLIGTPIGTPIVITKSETPTPMFRVNTVPYLLPGVALALTQSWALTLKRLARVS
jgi:hypothetical protein